MDCGPDFPWSRTFFLEGSGAAISISELPTELKTSLLIEECTDMFSLANRIPGVSLSFWLDFTNGCENSRLSDGSYCCIKGSVEWSSSSSIISDSMSKSVWTSLSALELDSASEQHGPQKVPSWNAMLS